MIRLGGSNDQPPQVAAYPSYGFQTRSGSWRINVAGIAYQTPPFNLRQKMMLRMLINLMKATESELQSQTFQDRIWPFFVEPEKGCALSIEIGGRHIPLNKKTRRNGHFDNWQSVDNATIENAAESSQAGKTQLRYRLHAPHPKFVPLDCVVELLPQRGFSVISDIDDTIKVTSVRNRRELLLNTFVREFRDVEGMAEIYRNWCAAGADFHYVSSSPWQLVQPLVDMTSQFGFPTGTMHLRNFRLRDQFLRKMMMIRRKGKATEINRLIKNLPLRKFVLVGDSGEKDPEIYQKICRRYPDQIEGIFIRELASRPMERERLEKMKRTAGERVCTVFSTSEDLGRGAEGIFGSSSQLAAVN